MASALNHGTCHALVVDEIAADRARIVSGQLHKATVEAAEEGGAILVDMVRLSAGHDIYSDDLWINGSKPRTGALSSKMKREREGQRK